MQKIFFLQMARWLLPQSYQAARMLALLVWMIRSDSGSFSSAALAIGGRNEAQPPSDSNSSRSNHDRNVRCGAKPSPIGKAGSARRSGKTRRDPCRELARNRGARLAAGLDEPAPAAGGAIREPRAPRGCCYL